MNRVLKIGSILFVVVLFSSFTIHKFYVSVTQIDYALDKKQLQIKMRIFVDDLNTALEQEHKRNFYLAAQKPSTEDIALMKAYLKEHFSVKVNQKNKEVQFFDTEMEDDILICYLVCNEVSKISTLEIKNSLFMEVFSEQQNIIHSNILGTKRSVLLTENNAIGLLNYK